MFKFLANLIFTPNILITLFIGIMLLGGSIFHIFLKYIELGLLLLLLLLLLSDIEKFLEI